MNLYRFRTGQWLGEVGVVAQSEDEARTLGADFLRVQYNIKMPPLVGALIETTPFESPMVVFSAIGEFH